VHAVTDFEKRKPQYWHFHLPRSDDSRGLSQSQSSAVSTKCFHWSREAMLASEPKVSTRPMNFASVLGVNGDEGAKGWRHRC
jgi:hypothetical protein